MEDDLATGRLVPLLEEYNLQDREPIHALFVGGSTIPARVRASIQSAWPDAAVIFPDDVNPLATHRLTVPMPTFPSDTLASLERVVELTDSEPVDDRIESILRQAQGAVRDLRSARCLLVSGFHAGLVRAPSARARSNEAFGARVRASYRTYGVRRVCHDLRDEGL